MYTFTNMYKLQFCRKCNKQRIFYIDDSMSLGSFQKVNAKTYGILHLWGQPTHEKFHILFAFTSMLKYATNIYSV